MSEAQTTQIRIKFEKLGSLMYISHLDLAKTMQRIMVRAGIDIWYSEGFNPQPKIVFAVPLPVGVESECEYMDIKINSPMECEEIKRRLNESFPSEMRALDVYIPEQKLKNVVYAEYEISIHSGNITASTQAELENLLSSDLFVTKKSKGGEKEINIKDFISSFDISIKNGEIIIHTIVFSGNDKNLNPELLVEAIRKNTPILNGSPLDEYYSIVRRKMLTSTLEEFK